MNLSEAPMLSKTRFLTGLQCHLRLWYQSYEPGRASEIPMTRQAIFDTGREVGKLAARLYPGGVLVEEIYVEHQNAVAKTAALMKDPKVHAIFEAAFTFDGVRARTDILERCADDSWNLVEVKSSTSVKKNYISDVAIQYYVLRGSGVTLNTAGILHLNSQYIYDGNDLDIDSLFSFSDLTQAALNLQDEIAALLKVLNEMLVGQQAPEIKPSRHCMRPYRCEFWDYCTRNMPEFWVLNLNGLNQSRLDVLDRLNINDISNIPDSFPMTPMQHRIRASVLQQQEHIAPALAAELNDVTYPVHFLDFETTGFAIPRYAGTKTYQAIPFQWSNHILYNDGVLEHHEYLNDEDKDPRKEFTRSMLDSLAKGGTIFIYTTYEKDIIRHLAEHLPAYRDQLMDTLERFKDLCEIIRRHYYHPKFHGSFSLKSVLPALLPAMSYDNLDIHEGNQASLEYLHMIDPSTSAGEKNRIRANLLAYCGQDTLAMVKIREELLKRFSN